MIVLLYYAGAECSGMVWLLTGLITGGVYSTMMGWNTVVKGLIGGG